MDKKFVCACGLTCCDCLFYSGRSEVYDTAAKLKQLIKESQLDVFLTILSKNEVNQAMAHHLGVDETEFADFFEPFKKLPIFFEVLEGIIKMQCQKTCQEANGCSMMGSLKECEAIKCVRQKGYAGCWECSDQENCDKLFFQRRSYGETITGNFKIIRENGMEAVKSRGNRYYEWQRRVNAVREQG